MKRPLLFPLVLIISTAAFSQTVTVNFAQPDPVNNMLGFLHGMDGVAPADSSIQKLHPEYWRGGALTNQIYSRATATFGTKYILAISDFYGYPQDNPNWIPPYSDTTYYHHFLDSVCSLTSTLEMIYQPWNEPDGSAYWSGSDLQFFQTFARAEHRIRQNLGDVVEIMGPSIATIDTAYLRNFCNYCLAHNVQLDYLSWHWFFNDVHVYLIEDALDWATAEFVNNPTYAPLQIKGIIIDEMTSPTQQYQPAHYLANLYYLEKGKALGAVHACWDALDGSGTSNCWNNTIDGLLTAETKQPRAVWWAAKCYSETVGGRVASASSFSEIISFAAKNEFYPDEANVLIAHYARIGFTSSLNVNVQLDNLSNAGFIANGDSVRIIAYKIPNDSVTAVASLAVAAQQNLLYNGQSISLSLPSLPVKEAYWLSIKKGNLPTSIDYAIQQINAPVIFPNPVSDKIFISGIGTQYLKVQVFNSMGETVLTTHNTGVVSTAGLPAGIYIVAVATSGQATYFKRIIITR